MAKNIYLGVDSKAHRMKKAYLGVDGTAREIKKIYVGVDGKARLVYTSYVPVESISLTNSRDDSYSRTVTAHILPEDATDKTVTWSVSAPRTQGSEYYPSWKTNDDGTLTVTVSGSFTLKKQSSYSNTIYITATTSSGKTATATLTAYTDVEMKIFPNYIYTWKFS